MELVKSKFLTSLHGELNMSFGSGFVKHQRKSGYELKLTSNESVSQNTKYKFLALYTPDLLQAEP